MKAVKPKKKLGQHFLLVIRRGENNTLQQMKGNGLFCKLKLNICFSLKKSLVYKINYVIFVPEIMSVKSDHASLKQVRVDLLASLFTFMVYKIN